MGGKIDLPRQALHPKVEPMAAEALLASWRHTPTRAGIVDFVTRVTNTPRPQLTADRNRYASRPGTAPVAGWLAVQNFVGITEQMVVGSTDVPTGHNLILSASLEKESIEADHTKGTLSIYHGDHKVGEAQIKTQLSAFAMAGAALSIGRPRGGPVTDDYPDEEPYTFTGGSIDRVAIDVSGEPYLDLDLEREAALTLMRE